MVLQNYVVIVFARVKLGQKSSTMRILNLFSRVRGALRLLMLKVINGGNLVLKSSLLSYNFCPNTKIRVSDGACVVMDTITTTDHVYLSVWKGILQIGKGCRFNRNDIVVVHSKIVIGDNTILGPNVCIYDHDHDFDHNGVIPGKYKTDDVHIGNKVWIGAGTIVLKGTQIGDNTIIGAGCIVKGDIPANSMVVARNRELIVTPLEEYTNKTSK